MKNNDIDIIDLQIAKGRQSVIYKETFSIGNKKFQISIKSDSYNMQSYAHINLWSGDKWNTVFSIHYNLMKTEHGLCYKKNWDMKSNFLQDRNYLLDKGLSVVM